MTDRATLVEEIRRRVPVEEIVARAVALKRRGREYLGLCPFHAERTPSFTVVPARGFFKCFGCGASGDVIGFHMRAAGLEFGAAVEELAQHAGLMPAPGGGTRALKAPRHVVDTAALEAEREASIAWTRALWAEGRSARGTLVEAYLRARGIEAAAIGGAPPSLRFHPRLWHAESGRHWPAMLGGVQGPTGTIVGVHRTFLAPDGSGKAPVAPAKKMGGLCWGGAVRFAKAGPALAIAEGIETALSVLQALGISTAPHGGAGGAAAGGRGEKDTGGISVWAALSLGNIAGAGRGPRRPHPEKPGKLLETAWPDWSRPGLVPPAGVARVILLADADNKDPAAAEVLLERAARRFRRRGLEVAIARPPAGLDFNDVLMLGGRAA